VIESITGEFHPAVRDFWPKGSNSNWFNAYCYWYIWTFEHINRLAIHGRFFFRKITSELCSLSVAPDRW